MSAALIKRFLFVRKHPALSAADFERRWLDALAHTARAARDAPSLLRTVACVSLQQPDLSPHDGIWIEWWRDAETLRQHAGPLPRTAAALIEPGTAVELVAQELILRGADWLEQRWLGRADKLKHMALARRAQGLTHAEFSERWRNRPGQIGGGQSPSLAIPEAAKGLAYCQNHPLPDVQGIEPAYDAINEVYFDRLEDMRPRLDFFRDQPVAQLDSDLVSEPRFMVVRERWIDG